MSTSPVVFGTRRPLPPPTRRRLPDWPDPLLGRCLVAFALGVAFAALVGVARAEDTDAPRYEPVARGGVREAVEQWRPMVEQYDWDADTALAVIRCESGGNPGVWNRQGSGARGLLQVMPMWRRLALDVTGSDDLADPAVNVATGHALYVAFGGWSPWWSSRACWAGGW